ncbi:MAG TPA: histidine phosphatase family protein [Pedobacter sp.]|nr:histidine phosphatase family protein [Pedobacter sp.]
MSKQLLLIRHGKSEWGNAHLADFDRPLNPRGHRNAPEMASRIAFKSLIPQLIVSSPAMRATTTARHFSEVWEMSSDRFQQEPDIYEANTITLLKIVNNLDNQYDHVALFGHNPGFTDFANYLTNAGIYNIPTCGTVLISFETDDWKEVSHSSGTLLEFDYPKSADED